MKVWLLTSELPEEFAGGIARYIDNSARLLGGQGVEVMILARSLNPADRMIAPNVRRIGFATRDTKLHEVNPTPEPDTHPAYPHNVMSYGPALSYQMAEEVTKLLRELPAPDIIESQDALGIAWFLMQKKLTEPGFLPRTPIIINLRGPYFEVARVNQEPRYQFPEYWIGQMEKFCIVAADALLSPSRFLANATRQVLQRPLEISVIPSPLGPQQFSASKEVVPRQIIYVGRMEVRKGVLPLVETCSRLWKQGETFTLTMSGGDTFFHPRGMTVETYIRQRYAQWIESRHLLLTGNLPHSEVMKRLQQAWAVVIPSLWENFPNTCMEAMSAGQVVLVSRPGGQAEMVEADGVNGFIFDWDRPGDFESKLKIVLNLTPNERREIGDRACTRINEFCDPEQITARRIAHYQSVIEQYSPPRSFPSLNSFQIDLAEPEPAIASARPESSRLGSEESISGLLSVIIPFYNLGKYLKETRDSILRSTYSPLEIIVVNDGSTDQESLCVLAEIESSSADNIRVIHSENQGLPSARNLGVASARGEFIALVDADDLVEPEFYEQATYVLRRYPNVTFVYSWVRYFGEARGFWLTWNTEFPYLLGHNMASTLVVLRRASILKSGLNKPALAYSLEDYEGWLNLVEAGGVGVSLSAPLVRYRVRPDSMYRSATRDQKLFLFDLITDLHAESYRRWGKELFNLQMANGPGYLWNNPAMRQQDLSEHVIALEKAKEWLEGQVGNYQAEVGHQQAVIAELKSWIMELEKGKAWLEEQRANWQAEAERGGQLIAEQRAWIAKLGRGKAWLKRQLSNRRTEG